MTDIPDPSRAIAFQALLTSGTPRFCLISSNTARASGTASSYSINRPYFIGLSVMPRALPAAR